MPTCIYITSLERGTGKTVISLALAYLMRERGLKVGAFKPFSLATATLEGKPVDESVLTLKSILEMSESLDVINPVVVASPSSYIEKVLSAKREEIEQKISESWNAIATRYEVVLVLGYRSCTHMILGKIPEIELASRLGCAVLAVVTPSAPDILGELAYLRHLCESYKIEFLGVILNRVRSQVDREEWTSAIEMMGIDILGIVPEIPSLHNPTLRDLVREIGGRVICCDNALDTTFEHVLVGAMSPDLASRYFRAISGKVVITGGDRADLIMLALETDTRAIILTGGVHPSPRVVAEAERRNVPLIVVPYDTYTTVRLIHSMCGKIRPGDRRLEIVKAQVARHINVDRILERMGIVIK